MRFADRRADRSPGRSRREPAVEPIATSSTIRASPRRRGTTISSLMWRIAFDNRCGVRLDDVGEVGLRIMPPERAQERRREHHVADRAQPDQQDAHYSWSTVASSISITGMSSLMG